MNEDALSLARRAEQLQCELFVLRDILQRAGWYLGTDVQATDPTDEQREQFKNEVEILLAEHGKK